MSKKETQNRLRLRREFLKNIALTAGTAGIGVAANRAASAQGAAPAAAGGPTAGIQVAKRGEYAKVALRQDSINVTAVQSVELGSFHLALLLEHRATLQVV